MNLAAGRRLGPYEIVGPLRLEDDGTVNVLDFGLAKVTEPVGAMSAGAQVSLTATRAA